MPRAAFPQQLILLAISILLVGCAPARTEPQASTEPAPTPSQLVLKGTATSSPTPNAPTSATATERPSLPARAAPPAGDAGDRWDSPADGMTLVYVPEGSFAMGASADFEPAEPDERPQREVDLEAYWIDSTEVTVRMYKGCVDDGACSPPASSDSPSLPADHPVGGVTWHQADTYCQWAGRELPTEAQWEKAARGEDGRRYPWGWIGGPESAGDIRLNFCDVNCPFDYRAEQFDDGYARSAPVGSYPAGASPYNALDLAGNVWEWTSDWYQADQYKPTPTGNTTTGTVTQVRSIRGGSWAETAWEGIALISRASNRFWHPPDESRPDLGFRCAVEVSRAD